MFVKVMQGETVCVEIVNKTLKFVPCLVAVRPDNDGRLAVIVFLQNLVQEPPIGIGVLAQPRLHTPNIIIAMFLSHGSF